MSIELEEIHTELTTLAEEFNLKPPRDIEYYLSDVEEFELMEGLIDQEYQMLSIDQIKEDVVDIDSILEDEAELTF